MDILFLLKYSFSLKIICKQKTLMISLSVFVTELYLQNSQVLMLTGNSRRVLLNINDLIQFKIHAYNTFFFQFPVITHTLN